MRLTYLNFVNRVSRTICAFTDSEEWMKFIQHYTEEHYADLPTVNPLHKSIPTFETAEQAINYFECVARPTRKPRKKR